MRILSVITYLIYTIFWEGLCIGGTAYLVFWRGHSGWWFLLAVMLSSMQYGPVKWRGLWDTSVAPDPQNK
jgi:hypothetical protein